MNKDADTTGVEIFGLLAGIAETAIGLALSKRPVAKGYEHYGKIAAIGAAILGESAKAAINASNGEVGKAIGGGIGSTLGVPRLLGRR